METTTADEGLREFRDIWISLRAKERHYAGMFRGSMTEEGE